jgi:hypothetical protein
MFGTYFQRKRPSNVYKLTREILKLNADTYIHLDNKYSSSKSSDFYRYVWLGERWLVRKDGILLHVTGGTLTTWDWQDTTL